MFLNLHRKYVVLSDLSLLSFLPPQLKAMLMPRSFSTYILAVQWWAPVTHWSGILRWIGACLTATQEKIPFWERRLSTHTRYFSHREELLTTGKSCPRRSLTANSDPFILYENIIRWRVFLVLCLCPQAYYYSAIVEDVLLRFAWTLTVTLSTVSGVHGMSDILATILAPLEVFRCVSLFVSSYNLDIFFRVSALL